MTTTMKSIVRLMRRISRAISLGVFCRFAFSTILIMLSRKVSPGFTVILTVMVPERTFVPPVTPHRSPPDSLMTGRGFSRNGGFVHQRCSFGDVAVAGHRLSFRDNNDIALAQGPCGYFFTVYRSPAP